MLPFLLHTLLAVGSCEVVHFISLGVPLFHLHCYWVFWPFLFVRWHVYSEPFCEHTHTHLLYMKNILQIYVITKFEFSLLGIAYTNSFILIHSHVLGHKIVAAYAYAHASVYGIILFCIKNYRFKIINSFSYCVCWNEPNETELLQLFGTRICVWIKVANLRNFVFRIVGILMKALQQHCTF